MRAIFTTLAVLVAFMLSAQNTIWSHAIGNWRDGPVVYITPLIETTEAFTTPQLVERYKAEFQELKDVVDVDVLRFGTVEEGEESRRLLRTKYHMRKLEVVMLEAPRKKSVPEVTAAPE